MFEKQIKDENSKIEQQDNKKSHATVEVEAESETKKETEEDLQDMVKDVSKMSKDIETQYGKKKIDDDRKVFAENKEKIEAKER